MSDTACDRIKVLLLTQPTVGGAALQVWQLASLMDGERFRVTVGSPESGWLRAMALAHGLDHRSLEFVRQISPLRDLRAFLDVLRLVRKERPQVIHAHSSKAGILGRLAGALCHVSVIVYTPHGFAFLLAQGPPRWVYLWLEKAASLVTDRIICVSDTEREGALKYRVSRPDKFVVIRNGVEYPKLLEAGRGVLRQALGAGREDLIVAMISRLRRPKQPEELLRAAQLLSSTQAKGSLRFVFIGSGPLERDSRVLARDLGVEDRVTFLGDRLDVPTLMADIDIVVLASSMEGLPYSILEAMAAGKPVVGSRVPGIEDLIIDGTNGYLYTLGDATELAQGLGRLLANERLRLRMGREGRRTVQEGFTAERMVRETQELYSAHLADKSRPQARTAKRSS